MTNTLFLSVYQGKDTNIADLPFCSSYPSYPFFRALFFRQQGSVTSGWHICILPTSGRQETKMELDQLAIGNRIHALRRGKDMSCVKAAMALNISESLLRKVESGERPPSIGLLMGLSEFYGVSTDYLLKGPCSSLLSDRFDTVIESLRSLKQEIERN